jgi:hypothetical protein
MAGLVPAIHALAGILYIGRQSASFPHPALADGKQDQRFVATGRPETPTSASITARIT